MSKTENYRQCRLTRPVGTGVQETTSWLPECFAQVGAVLKLRGPNGVWADGWTVRSAGPPMEARVVEANSRNYLRQRHASDVVFADIKRQNEVASRS